MQKDNSKKIDKLYNETHQYMMNILNQCDKIAISTDLWTSNSTGIPFIAITGHFISRNYEYQKILLDFSEFEHPHTMEKIHQKSIFKFGTSITKK